MVPRRRCELLRGRPLDLKHLPVPVEEVADARDLLVVHEPADERALLAARSRGRNLAWGPSSCAFEAAKPGSYMLRRTGGLSARGAHDRRGSSVCLAVPARVLSTDGARARIEIQGREAEADASLFPVRPGDFVLVSTGLIIQLLDPAEAEEQLRLLAALEDTAPR